MRRLTVAVALLVAAVLPLGSVVAREHCSNPVWFLTGTGLLYHMGAVGCDVVVDDFPETPGDDSNTDWITPGAAEGLVRFFTVEKPVDGVVGDDGSVTGSKIEFTGRPAVALRFVRGTDATGAQGDFWDSQRLPIGRGPSVDPAFRAKITVCYEARPTHCQVREYRTVTAV